MNVPTVEMAEEEAAGKAMEYAAAIAAGKYPDTADGRRQKEIDASAVKGFQALAHGQRVINVHTALSFGGQFIDGPHEGLPRLAIARADARRVYFTGENIGTKAPTYKFDSEFSANGYTRKNGLFQFKGLVWNAEMVRAALARQWRFQAIVPAIPPSLRPHHAQLRKYAILWEADWERAPSDPFLLQHLAGDLYLIVAEWDLTELERGLLEQSMLRS